jgi:hypothetical protein
MLDKFFSRAAITLFGRCNRIATTLMAFAFGHACAGVLAATEIGVVFTTCPGCPRLNKSQAIEGSAGVRHFQTFDLLQEHDIRVGGRTGWIHSSEKFETPQRKRQKQWLVGAIGIGCCPVYLEGASPLALAGRRRQG